MSRHRTEQAVPTIDRLERFALPLQLALGGGVLALYVLTLFPSVAGGDSGELTVVAYRLGVAHPPGYPLFTLFGKLATLLPLGEIAWRVNLLTALFGAAAAAVLFRATWRLNGSAGAGLLAAGLFAFSPLVWRYSVAAEVFSLNNLFMAILVALVVSYEREPRDRTVYVFALVSGLGLANHQTLVFCAAPLGIWLLLRARKSMLRPGPLLVCSGLVTAGLTPYLYLLVRPAADPLTTWGDTSTISGFLTHVTRGEYGTLRLGVTGETADLGRNLAAYLENLPRQLLWIGIPLVLLALPLTRAGGGRQTRAVRALLVAWLTYVTVFHSLSNMPLDQPLFHEIHSRFWQEPNLILCVLAGTGFCWVTRRALSLAPAAVAILALALVLLQVGVNYSAEDQSDNRVVANLARKTLKLLPPNALVISQGDLHWNSLRYMQVCEGERRDVLLLDIEMLEAPWMDAMVRRSYEGVTLPGPFYRTPSRSRDGSYDLLQLIDANYGNFPILSNALQGKDNRWRSKYTAWPAGFFDRLYAGKPRIDVESYLELTDGWARVVEGEFTREYHEGSWETVARQAHADSEARRGTQLLGYALDPGLEASQLDRAGRILEHAIELSAEPDPGLYLNTGIYYYLVRDVHPSAVEKMVRVWSHYLQVAPGNTSESRLVEKALADPENVQLGLGAR
jgi:hypothetical protein